ncbi:MAG: tetratricopeptide repeat protein [Chloroflexi bacterium]|nr:tetratricopeptide repeat protein [Chloroflexota bacterium]
MSERINPYIAGAPVTDARMFFGRDDVFDWIAHNLAGRYADHILVIHGQRRVGKTSVLKQLPNRLPERYIPVFFDLQGRTHTTLDRFLWWLAREIVRTLKQDRDISIPLADQEVFSADPDYFDGQFLPALQPLLGDRNLLLTFDEFDVLQETEVRDTLARPLVDYLRRLMGREGLNFIFSIGSSGRKLENMQASYTEFFKAALYKRISFLTREDACNLITRPVEGVLEYDPGAVNLICEITSGHPYFTQLVCHELFWHCQKTNQRRIGEEDVLAVLDDVVERGTVNLKSVWDEASYVEKWVLAGLTHLEGKPNVRILADFLRRQRVPLSNQDLESALLHLRESDVLTEDNRFVIHLMRLWLQKNRPLERVREELTEVGPLVSRHIEMGLDYKARRLYDKAIECFRQALEVDPDNIQAQVSIASVYLAQKAYQKAAAEYQKALAIDEGDVAARTGLCEAHLALGDQALSRGRLIEATQSYQEVLAINAEHSEARQRMADIHHRRAEKALAEGRDDEALSALKEALRFTPEDQGLEARYADLREQKGAKILAGLLARAEKEGAAKNWERAIAILEEALALAPEDQRIQERLAAAQEAQRAARLESLLGRANQATESGRWDEAVAALEEYVALQPEDVAAQERLANARERQRKSQLNSLKVWARSLAKAEKWDEALTIWHEYLALEPEDAEAAQSEIQQVERSRELARAYIEAQVAMSRKDYDRAITLLKGIISKDETYRDAPRVLAQAIELRRTAGKFTPARPKGSPLIPFLIVGALFVLLVTGAGAFLVYVTGFGKPRPTPTPVVSIPTPKTLRMYGPVDGELVHERDDSVSLQFAGVDARDFMAEVRFYNPYDRSEGSWDYGFGFRRIGPDNEYRLYVDSGGDWTFVSANKQGEGSQFDTVASGKVENLDLSATGSNHLRLVVQGNTALFFANGEYIATLDVSGKDVPGDVWLGTVMQRGYGISGKRTRYEDFVVWPLTQTYGPADGNLRHEEGDRAQGQYASAYLRDFAAEARFYNPYAPSEGRWDYGFGFRQTADELHYRLHVNSDAEWILELLTGHTAGVWEYKNIASGQLTNLDTSATGANRLRLVVQGDTAFFFVNDEYITALDVSEKNVPGNVWLGTGMRRGYLIAGKSTRYEDFTVWPLGEIYGPADGALAHNEDGSLSAQYTGLRLRDFLAYARFYNPYDRAERTWSYGFGFRDMGGDNEYRLYVDSEGVWALESVTKSGDESEFKKIAGGKIRDLDTSPTGSNFLHLAAQGGTAIFFVNGEYVATLDVSGKNVAGDIWVGTGLKKEHGMAGKSTRYEGFTIWPLYQDFSIWTQAGVYGPMVGSLPHREGVIASRNAGLQLRDFVAEARFYNPYDRSEGGWDYGFGFRETGSDNQYRLYVDSSGGWTLNLATKSGDKPVFNKIASGKVNNLDLTATGSNHLRLIVQGSTGLFFANGEFIATLDLSGKLVPGSIWVGTSMVKGHERVGKSTRYEDFIIWPLSEMYGPADGSMEHQAGVISSHEADVHLRDFIAEARFYNPYDRAESTWDYGFVFRYTGVDNEYCLYVDSDANWQLVLVTKSDDKPEYQNIANGKANNLDLTATGSNQLRLIVEGNTAFFFVNDRYITALDVSGRDVAGDVWVATAMVQNHGIVGRTTRYEDFTIWPLP